MKTTRHRLARALGGCRDAARSESAAADMAARRDRIRYVADTLPRGGQVRIVTPDSAALAAIHEFLAFQRSDHRAGGHQHGN